MKRPLEHFSAWRPEVLMEYYLALKARHFVILAGPPDVEKMSLARRVADAMTGKAAPLQWCSLQAHAWWSTRTGRPARFAMAQAQLNFLKVLDFLALATAYEPLGLPCFLVIERISPAEAVSYFCDLPRGLLWRADASILRVRVPENLYVTGTFDTQGDGPDLGEFVHEYAAVMHVGPGDLTTDNSESAGSVSSTSLYSSKQSKVQAQE